MKINLEFIKQFNPCLSGIRQYINAGYENFNGTILEFLQLEKISIENRLWVVLREEIIPTNDLHELVCKLAESVLHIYEKEYPDDERPRLAIEAKRKWLKGEISSDELEDARVAARDAASAATSAAVWAAWAAVKAAWAAWADVKAAWAAWAAVKAAWAAVWDASAAARGSISAATWDAISAATWDAAWATEREKQLNIVIEYFMNREVRDGQ